MLCMRTAHSTQCTGTVPHCREENSSRQLHFKLKKIPISARIVFSTVVACICSSYSQCREAPCPVSKSSNSIAISESGYMNPSLFFSTSGKFIWGWGMLSIERRGQQAQPGAGLPALCVVPDCPLPESVGCTTCSFSAASPFPPHAMQCCQV